MLASHLGDGAEGTQSVATFRNLQVGEMLWGDADAMVIGQRADRCRSKHRPLLLNPTENTIGHVADLFTTKDTDQPIDLWPRLQQRFPLSLGQATRYQNSLDLPLFF
jgi:hypothetical protein